MFRKSNVNKTVWYFSFSLKTLLETLFFFIRSLKSKKKKLPLTSFHYVSWEIHLYNSKKLICIDHQDSTCSHTRENSKMLIIASKYFSFFNNKPPASWMAHIIKDFLTCYSCSYHSSMIWAKIFAQNASISFNQIFIFAFLILKTNSWRIVLQWRGLIVINYLVDRTNNWYWLKFRLLLGL